MDKKEFLEVLKRGASMTEAKIECLQFFIDNYPVLATVNETKSFGFISSHKEWTALKGIKITGGREPQINWAFVKLQKRYSDLANFKTAKYD